MSAKSLQNPPAAGEVAQVPSIHGYFISASEKKLLASLHPDRAAFIVRACNSHTALVAALERSRREFSDCEDHLVRLRPDVQPDPYVTGCREALAIIAAALAAAKGVQS